MNDLLKEDPEKFLCLIPTIDDLAKMANPHDAEKFYKTHDWEAAFARPDTGMVMFAFKCKRCNVQITTLVTLS